MDLMEREKLVNRIASGVFRCRILDNFGKLSTFIIKTPNNYQKYIANELYDELLVEYRMEGLYSDEEVLAMLIKKDLWTIEEENNLLKLEKDIEEFKVKLFNVAFKPNQKTKSRKLIQTAIAEKRRLESKKNSYMHMSASSSAMFAKMRYLIGTSIFYENGTKVFENEDFWKEESPLLDRIISLYNEFRLEESDYRELARNEPWRSIWFCSKPNVFGKSGIELTDEQKGIIYWSLVYDNIRENSDCPSDDVIDDDDALDGWLILQNRERKKKFADNQVEGMIPDSMKNAHEIFIPVNPDHPIISPTKEDVEDAAKISAFNDVGAKAIIMSREKIISKKGVANELDMPDVRQRLKMEATQKLSKSMKERQG